MASHYELFGSDSEEDPEEDAAAAAAVGGEDGARDAPAGDGDDLDDDAGLAEDELFGGASDDDEEEAAASSSEPSGPPLHFEVPEVPRNKGGSMYLVRLPNMLRLEPREFDADYEGEDFGEGDDERKRASNVVRWRENKETGEKESNARFVRWSDGSMN